LAPCTLVVGPNGSGKTNLYRAMRLVADAVDGRLGRAIAEEGGMQSVLWAGERREDERSCAYVELAWDDLTYALELALPNPFGFGFGTRFQRDPSVPVETIRVPSGKHMTALLDRGHASCMVRNAEGARVTYAMTLAESESVLSQIAEAHVYTELSALRSRLGAMRFYHHFRTDRDAPMRIRAWARVPRCWQTTARISRLPSSRSRRSATAGPFTSTWRTRSTGPR
jgi:predicted ATPase